MPIGNATWGDFTCDTEAEMLENSNAVVGTTCFRSDLDLLLRLNVLPPANAENWGEMLGSYVDVQYPGASNFYVEV